MASLNESPVVETVVIQPTPFCNINCSYCYLPQRNVTTVIDQATVLAFFGKLFASDWLSEDLTLIWHAGEPLVVPIAFYETAFAAIEALRPGSLRVQHSFQTNGMLITSAWCDLFRKWSVNVGVSIDGPKHLHDAHRVTRTGRGTFDRTLAGIQTLRQDQIPFHVISVLSREGLTSVQQMLDFYHLEGIEDVCFNVEESEGDHVSELFTAGDAQESYRRFLGDFWRLARQELRIRFIREIDGMLPRVFRPDKTTLRNIQAEPFAMLNMDCHGNVSTFSPELLGLKSAEHNNFIIGNILKDSLEEMARSAAMIAMQREVAAGVEKCRQTCGYFSVCGGGAPVNKFSENGSFDSTETSFCRLTQMVPIDLILDAFDQMNEGASAKPSQLRTSESFTKNAALAG